MSTYTITRNEQFNSLEIAFVEKPSAAVREALKALRFRWHSKKCVWYGYADEAAARAACEGTQKAAEAPQSRKAAAKVNKYGIQVGDIFSASWGYEQTNNDFFQVVELVGASSVRVVEVSPAIISSEAVCSMSEDRVMEISREPQPRCSSSVFIKDQERGDLKRLKSYAADGVSNPQFFLASFTDAHYCQPGTKKVYESWYY